MNLLRRRAVLLCAAIFSASSVGAQSEPPSDVQKTVFRSSDAIWFGTFAAGSVALTRFDTRITRWFRDSTRQGDKTLHTLADNLTKIQETRLTVGGLLIYAIGRLSKSEPIADVGLHSAEAVFTASVASQIIRGPLGRSRPALSEYNDPYQHRFFRGFTEFNYRAFPSIHASSGFGFATVLIAETSRRNPRANWAVAPVAAIIAASPCYSRLYLGQHWASDILMGAFMGTFAGLRVVDYSHDHPTNRVDRFFLGKHAHGLTILPSSGGVQVSYGGSF
jgi:membrane-associated phospholipid phosphatase